MMRSLTILMALLHCRPDLASRQVSSDRNCLDGAVDNFDEAVVNVLNGKNRPLKKLYLDVCTLCRPFDDQHLLRIRLETNACYLILQAIQGGKYEMVLSPVHLEEINSIGDSQEKNELLALLAKFAATILYDLPRTRMRAEELFSKGYGIADAAHVALQS